MARVRGERPRPRRAGSAGSLLLALTMAAGLLAADGLPGGAEPSFAQSYPRQAVPVELAGSALRGTPNVAPSQVFGIRARADLRAAVDMRFLAAAGARGGSRQAPKWVAPSPGFRSFGFAAPPAALEAPPSPATEQAFTAEAAALPASPPLSASFAGVGDNGTVIPPDSDGAAGPNHLMAVLNSQVQVQDRQGSVLTSVSLDDFWSSLGIGFAFDPRVGYDALSERWFVVSAADPNSPTSALLIAVSATADPTSGWNLYKVPIDPKGALWADFPTVGFSRDWIVVQANLYTTGSGFFSHSAIYAFDKRDLYSGATGLFTRLDDASGGFTQFPASTYDPDVAVVYLLETWSAAAATLRLSVLEGPVGAESLQSGAAYVQGSAPWQSRAPQTNFAPQAGSPNGIDTNDDRLLSCVYRNGALWTSHTIFLPFGTAASRSAVQWWQVGVGPSLGAVLQSGRIDDPTGSVFFAYPSLAVNRKGDAMLGFSRFSVSSEASAAYALRLQSDPPGTTRPGQLLKAGEAPYNKTFGTGENRWGDYNSVVVDPANDADFWTLQEYAAAGNSWGTWWGRVALTAPAPTSTPAPTPASTPAPTPAPTPDGGSARGVPMPRGGPVAGRSVPGRTPGQPPSRGLGVPAQASNSMPSGAPPRGRVTDAVWGIVPGLMGGADGLRVRGALTRPGRASISAASSGGSVGDRFRGLPAPGAFTVAPAAFPAP